MRHWATCSNHPAVIKAKHLQADRDALLKALHEIVDTLSPDDYAHWVAVARAAISQAESH